MKKTYVIKKVVEADDIKQALEIEGTAEVCEIREAVDKSKRQLSPAIGFHADAEPEDEWES